MLQYKVQFYSTKAKQPFEENDSEESTKSGTEHFTKYILTCVKIRQFDREKRLVCFAGLHSSFPKEPRKLLT